MDAAVIVSGCSGKDYIRHCFFVVVSKLFVRLLNTFHYGIFWLLFFERGYKVQVASMTYSVRKVSCFSFRRLAKNMFFVSLFSRI